MSKRKRRPAVAANKHVRLYRHELDSAAYRALSCDARALLIEMRALYSGGSNRVCISVRDMAKSLGANVSPGRASRARDELVHKGFIRELRPGAFSQKAGTRRAAEYALLHEPLDNAATAEKPFMRWTPEKGLVSTTNTFGLETHRHARSPEAPDRIQSEHGITRSTGSGLIAALLDAALRCDPDGRMRKQFIGSAICWAAALTGAGVGYDHSQRGAA